MLFSGLVMLVVGLRVLTFSGAGLKIIAQRDMQDAVQAQHMAYEHLADARLGLESLMDACPRSALYMRVHSKCELWFGPPENHGPLTNNLSAIEYVQSAHDAFRRTGVVIPDWIMNDIHQYGYWTNQYDRIMDAYNLTGWNGTPTLYGFNPWLWNGTSP